MNRPTQVLPKDFLEQKYLTEGQSMVDIGRLVDRDPKTILFWMRKYGIPTRPRGDTRNFNGHHVIHRVHSEATKQKIREAVIKLGKVPYLQNGEHWLKGKHGAEVPNWKGGITPERQTFYRTEGWKDVAALVWDRDKGTCQRCGALNSASGHQKRFHIHHIVSFEKSVKLRADPNNLVVLCCACHMWVHSTKNTQKEFIV